MHIILAMVISVNGKSTKGELAEQSWASEEDKLHLKKLVSETNLILMGGNTYQAAKNHIKPKEGKLRVVVTRNPEKFENDQIEGQLEFMNLPPQELVKKLEERGFTKMLLLSGESLNKDFFEEKLINEIALTIEPKLFGSGRGIVAESSLDLSLKLVSLEKANENGTLFLNYEVSY